MDLRQVLQSELIMAMKKADRPTMTVLRNVLGVIANAEAVPPTDRPAAEGSMGYADVERQELSPQQIKLIMLDEIESRRNSAGYFDKAGRDEEAAALQNEAAILERYLYLTQ